MTATTRPSLPLVALCLSIALAHLGACTESAPVSADADAATGTATCERREDCESLGADHRGLVCGANGQCEPCASDGQCRLKERCDGDTARCVFREGFGDDCTFNDECAAGEFCVQGLCRAALDVTLCVQGACLASGQRCDAINGVCEVDLGCVEDGDCAESELCNLPTRTCVTRCTGESAALLCLPTQTCLVDRCADCATDADCADGMTCDLDALSCVLDDGGVTRCISDRDCAIDQTCDPDLGVCLPRKPPCTSDESCALSERCDIASGKCLPRQCEPDRFEPNDTVESAEAQGRVLGEGAFSSLTICGQDVDHLLVDLTRGDALTATLDADVLLDGHLRLDLVDPESRRLGSGGFSASGVAVLDGRHAIRVTHLTAQSGTRVDYGLTIALSTGTPCDFDRFEPNDSPATASLLDASATALFEGLTICGDDSDFFRVQAPEVCALSLEAKVTGGEGALDVEEIAAGESPHFWTPSEANERLFRVQSPLPRVQLTYTLALQRTACAE